MIGGFSIGNAGPCLNNFAAGKSAAIQIFKVIDRIPKIVIPPNAKKIEKL